MKNCTIFSRSSGGTPSAHAPSHTDGTDDIQNATSIQKGLATATQITKLDGIEALADVTDETNVISSLNGATITGATVATGDKVLIQDIDDSDNLKTVTAQSIADLASAGGTTQGVDTTTYAIQAANPGATAPNNLGEYAVDLQTLRSASADCASGANSVICGGRDNKSTAADSTVCGGYNNESTGAHATIGGGLANVAGGEYSFIGSGNTNEATASYAVVCGGQLNDVKSGTHSAIVGGSQNIASGIYSFVGGGANNEATASGSFVCGGYQGKAYLLGQYAHGGVLRNAAGDVQYSRLIAQAQTTDATVTTMQLGGTDSIDIPTGKSWLAKIKVLGRCIGGTSGTVGLMVAYEIDCIIENTSGTTRVALNNQTILVEDTGMSGMNAVVDATSSVTNDALDIDVTGLADWNMAWVATIELTEVA